LRKPSLEQFDLKKVEEKVDETFIYRHLEGKVNTGRSRLSDGNGKPEQKSSNVSITTGRSPNRSRRAWFRQKILREYRDHPNEGTLREAGTLEDGRRTKPL